MIVSFCFVLCVHVCLSLCALARIVLSFLLVCVIVLFVVFVLFILCVRPLNVYDVCLFLRRFVYV